MKSASISLVKPFLLLFLVHFLAPQVVVATPVQITMITGGDDLRGSGNQAYITINYADGTTSHEYPLGGGFARNYTVTKSIHLLKNITSLTEIKNVVLRHDGSPRTGFPADTYDNWDLKTLKISLTIGSRSEMLIDETGNPLVRFTGQLRNMTFTPKSGASSVPPKTSTLKVFLTTGSDDLRGGNSAYLTVNYTNGTSSPEFNLGGGFGQNSLKTVPINLGNALADVSEIKSITVRHDGSPRAGQPFDTYDNWDMQSIRIALVFTTGVERNVINKNGNPLVRYTGQLRTSNWLRE